MFERLSAAIDDLAPDTESLSLEQVLHEPLVGWCAGTIDSCEPAASILDQREFDSGKMMSTNSADTLAMYLPAAEQDPRRHGGPAAGLRPCDLT
jgi:hypothetical protein